MNKSSLNNVYLKSIILKLLNEKREMCGFEITQTVKSLHQETPAIAEGALYPMLHRLEGEGVLEARLENIGNRVRKYYSLSQAGKKQTQKSKMETLQFLKTLEIFLKPKLV